MSIVFFILEEFWGRTGCDATEGIQFIAKDEFVPEAKVYTLDAHVSIQSKFSAFKSL